MHTIIRSPEVDRRDRMSTVVCGYVCVCVCVWYFSVFLPVPVCLVVWIGLTPPPPPTPPPACLSLGPSSIQSAYLLRMYARIRDAYVMHMCMRARMHEHLYDMCSTAEDVECEGVASYSVNVSNCRINRLGGDDRDDWPEHFVCPRQHQSSNTHRYTNAHTH